MMSKSKAIFDTTDGRRLRSRDSKLKIVAAMLELVREGRIAPTAEEVAQRANVGLRTVFRRFKDMESLYAEMAVAISDQLAPIIDVALGDNNWPQNFIQLVQRRLKVYEIIRPYRVAEEVLKFQSNILQKHHLDIVRAERVKLKSVLPKSLTKDLIMLEALEAVLSFDMWNQLRSDQNLSAEEGGDVVNRILTRLLPELATGTTNKN
ncbi:MAG: TetR/AcrR family transcriptional regulator [Pseudomonadales bacterium]